MRNVWLLAFLVSAVVGVGAILFKDSRESIQVKDADYFALDRISEGSVVLIGSSLLRASVPHEMATNKPLQSSISRPYVRVTQSARTEEKATRLLGEALNRSADLIYVQLDLFIIKVATKNNISAKSIEYSNIMRRALKFTFNEISNKLRLSKYTGINYNTLPNLSRYVSQEFDGRISGRRKNRYPLQLVNPRQPDELRRVLQKAKSKGVKVVFFYPPRSQAAADFHGPEFTRTLARKQAQFEQDFEVDIWLPSLVWPNKYFADAGHVNGLGRKLFTTLLAQRMDFDLGRE